jgi:hypothetical protein
MACAILDDGGRWPRRIHCQIAYYISRSSGQSPKIVSQVHGWQFFFFSLSQLAKLSNLSLLNKYTLSHQSLSHEQCKYALMRIFKIIEQHFVRRLRTISLVISSKIISSYILYILYMLSHLVSWTLTDHTIRTVELPSQKIESYGELSWSIYSLRFCVIPVTKADEEVSPRGI